MHPKATSIGPSCRSRTGEPSFFTINHLETNTSLRGESGVGKWSVVVKDTNVNEHNGSFTDWKLTLWGECIDPSKQELLPSPTEEDDDDHDVLSVAPTFVSVNPGPTDTAELPANPTDHQHRPINAKPTAGATTSQAASPATPSATASGTALPDTPPEDKDKETHFLPHYFPTFGVSHRTQIWIYGAFAIIVLFCAGLGTYFFVQRRKRRRSEREEYEFEALEEEDGILNGNGAGGGRKKGRRAGELYDAFAGESDEEKLLSESEGEEEDYRDEGPGHGGDGGRVVGAEKEGGGGG
jgi:kexin